MIFGLVKEGIMEIFYERLGTLRTKILAIMGTFTLSFRMFRVCGVPELFGGKDPISSRRWLADMVNTFRSRFYHERLKVKLLVVF